MNTGDNVVASIASGPFRGRGITQANIEFASVLGMPPHKIAIASVPIPSLADIQRESQREYGLWETA